jgi:ArsR family transcriptional regulator
MAGMMRALKALSDETRLRILRLLDREELSVAELQDILGMPQSRISMQLSQLRQSGLVSVRRSGQKSIYRTTLPNGSERLVGDLLQRVSPELTAAAEDDAGLELIVGRRKDKLRGYFDELAGRFGRHYIPGRSWQGLAEVLIRLLPRMVIADLGAGEATLSLMLARSAERVIAVDNSEKMVAYGSEVARSHGVENVEYRLGDLERVPLADGEADMALLHQSLHHALHPERALAEAARILKPGGRVVILDLIKHAREEARELYADVWLGFSQAELYRMLQAAGFHSPDIATVHREAEPPHFETVLAIASKPEA